MSILSYPRRKQILFFSTIMVLVVLIAPTQRAKATEVGKTIFQQRCFACHTIGEGRRVGPDLSGVHTRRTEAWMMKFIKSSQTVIKSGDPDAVTVFESFNKLVMPDHPDLSDQQIKAVIDHIKTSSGTTGAATEVETVTKPTEADIARGQELFQGIARLTNRGPSCNSCHHVKNDAVIGGGILAKELTTVFTRMGAKGVEAVLGSQPFPVMQAAYKDRPLTDDEVRALVGFLQHADETHAFQKPRDYGTKLFFSGVFGFVILMGFFSIFWFRRKRSSVNEDIYRRQMGAQ